jgi:hypothetical protein
MSGLSFAGNVASQPPPDTREALVEAPSRQPPVVSPPMICSTVPVMYEESAFDARNT